MIDIDDIREHYRLRRELRCVGQGFSDDDVGALLAEIERIKSDFEAERIRWVLLEPVAEQRGYARCQADVVAYLAMVEASEVAASAHELARAFSNGAHVGAAQDGGGDDEA